MSTLSGSSLTSWSPKRATSSERPSRRTWKDATIKERHFISPLFLYGKRTAEAPPAPPTGAERPGKGGKKGGKKALRAPKGNRRPTSRARVPLRRPITIPSASATMLKEDARRVLSATSPMCARYASGSARDTSALQRPARQPIHRVLPTPDLGRPSRGRYHRAKKSLRVLYLFSGTPRR